MATARMHVSNAQLYLKEMSFFPPINIDLPFEASDVCQGNSHQSENQEDPHVGSELDPPSQLILITATCPWPTNHHPGSRTIAGELLFSGASS